MPNGLLPIIVVGCVVLIVVASAAYRAGRAAGAKAAHRYWTTWTGVRPEELESHHFDEQLRHLRRQIGRPADAWPERHEE
jgi:hypothetical protein